MGQKGVRRGLSPVATGSARRGCIWWLFWLWGLGLECSRLLGRTSFRHRRGTLKNNDTNRREVPSILNYVRADHRGTRSNALTLFGKLGLRRLRGRAEVKPFFYLEGRGFKTFTFSSSPNGSSQTRQNQPYWPFRHLTMPNRFFLQAYTTTDLVRTSKQWFRESMACKPSGGIYEKLGLPSTSSRKKVITAYQ